MPTPERRQDQVFKEVNRRANESLWARRHENQRPAFNLTCLSLNTLQTMQSISKRRRTQ